MGSPAHDFPSSMTLQLGPQAEGGFTDTGQSCGLEKF